MTGYWDIHNHILPGVDDGSGSLQETLELVQNEHDQGIRHIVFTPHYRRGMFEVEQLCLPECMRHLQSSSLICISIWAVSIMQIRI